MLILISHLTYFFWSPSVISLKYGCFKASFIEILLIGSNATSLMNKSNDTLSKFLKYDFGSTDLNFGNVGLKSGSFWMFYHYFGVGVPWNWKILKIWSIYESPVKSGFFSINSAKMQPTAQISTPRLYCFCPKRTSGALYHKVSISWVKVLIGIPKALAKPKSAIFKSPLIRKKKYHFYQWEDFGAWDLCEWFFSSGRS